MNQTSNEMQSLTFYREQRLQLSKMMYQILLKRMWKITQNLKKFIKNQKQEACLHKDGFQLCLSILLLRTCCRTHHHLSLNSWVYAGRFCNSYYEQKWDGFADLLLSGSISESHRQSIHLRIFWYKI